MYNWITRSLIIIFDLLIIRYYNPLPEFCGVTGPNPKFRFGFGCLSITGPTLQ